MQFAVSGKSEVQNRSESADARPEGARLCPLPHPSPHSFSEEMKENTVFFILSFQGDLCLHSWIPLPPHSTNISVTFSC